VAPQFATDLPHGSEGQRRMQPRLGSSRDGARWGRSMSNEQEKKRVHAYRRMVQRVQETLRPGHRPLADALQAAKEKAVELDELTREEADTIADYLRRDLVEAAEYLSDTGEEMSRWLAFDLELLGERLGEYLQPLVDQTRVELERLAEQAQTVAKWHRGEVTVGGTFVCTKCNQVVHLRGPASIPPCRSCGGTLFQRVAPPPPGG
jgi:Zinc-ribbon containing domain